jgi:hypothetical protein
MYYGTLNGATATSEDLLAETNAIGGHLQRLVTNKANYSDNLSVFASTTSLQLKGLISDETGSGSLVFATSPTLVTPTLGAATATTINGTTIPTNKVLVTTDTGTVTSDMILDETIVDDDISPTAAITVTKIAPGTEGQVLYVVGGVATWVEPDTVPTSEAEQVANEITFNSSGTGGASGQTYNGSTAPIVSYNTVGAAPLSHTHGNITNAGAIGTTSGLMVKTTTSGVLTTLSAGADGQFLKHDGSWGTPAGTYSLPTASTSVLGGVKVDGTTVTITGGVISAAPQYTLPAATVSTLGGVRLVSGTVQTVAAAAVSSTDLRTYAAQLNSSNQIVVNVPWTDTAYTLPAATSSVLGGVKPDGTTILNTSGSISAPSGTYYAASGSATTSSARGKVFVSPSAPTGAVAGDLWFW